MKIRKNKNVWLTSFLAAAFMAAGAGVATANTVDASADNSVTAESVGLVMDKGAGVRLGTADGNNGIRFVLTMNKSEYSALMDKVGTDEGDLYSDISFGMIITKSEYVSDAKELSVENLFDLDTTDGVNNTKFEWMPEGADENWTVSEGKLLVVNQTFGHLGTAEDYENDYVGFASLVELHEYNLTQEFIGRGYMKYTTANGTVNYRMADYYQDSRQNNVRSMTYVAQKAVEDPEMANHVETLKSLYITHSAVVAEEVSVTVKHHKVDVHGNENVETQTLTGKKIGETVTATPLTDEAWIYDETRSTASGVAYANDKTVLDLYYDQNPEAVYDLWYVGTTASIEQTAALSAPAVGGVRYEKAELRLSLDLVEGTMPRIKFYLLNTDGVQVTDPAENGWINVADCYEEATGEYVFTTTFMWATGNWDVGSVWLLVEDGSYKLGVDVESVTILNEYDYDCTIRGARETTYTLPEAVTGAVQNDKAIVTLELTEIAGDLTKLHIQLKNKAGTTIANNNNSYFTLADCVTGEENTYAFELTFPWGNNDWDVTQIVFSVDSTSYIVGVNVKSVEIISTVTYDYKIEKELETTCVLPEALTGAVRCDKAVVTLELTEIEGDLTELHIQLKNAAGTTIANNNNKYFTLADCVTDEENVYTFELTFPWENGDWDVTQMVLSVKSADYEVGVNVKSMEIVPVEYDFKMNKTTKHTYELESEVAGALRYDSAKVTLEIVELFGDLTQVKLELLNTDLTDPLIANNDTKYYTLADCATGEENTYALTIKFPWASGDWTVRAIRLTVDGASYIFGVNVKSVEIIPAEYDCMINKATTYTYTLPEAVTGAVRYDKAAVTLELTEIVSDLTKIRIELLNKSGATIANNDNKYYTLADCATGVSKTYQLVISFPWAGGDWDITAIKFTVDSANYIVGVNVKAVEIQEVAYQLEYGFVSGSQTKLHTFDKVAGGVQNGYVKVTFDIAVFYGTVTNVQFNLCTDTAGATTVANSNKSWNEDGTKITTSGGQISMNNLNKKATVTVVTTFPWGSGNWDLQSIQLQLYGSNVKAGVSNIQVVLMPDFTPAE